MSNKQNTLKLMIKETEDLIEESDGSVYICKLKSFQNSRYSLELLLIITAAINHKLLMNDFWKVQITMTTQTSTFAFEFNDIPPNRKDNIKYNERKLTILKEALTLI